MKAPLAIYLVYHSNYNDSEKVFSELYKLFCRDVRSSLSDGLVGKRAVAISQIFETISLMAKHDVLWNNILTRYEKRGIIGWREY